MFTEEQNLKAFAGLRIEANRLRLIDRSYEQENGRVILSCLLEADETSRASVDGLHCVPSLPRGSCGGRQNSRSGEDPDVPGYFGTTVKWYRPAEQIHFGK